MGAFHYAWGEGDMWIYVAALLLAAIAAWKFLGSGSSSSAPRGITPLKIENAPPKIILASKKAKKVKQPGQIGLKVYFGSQTGTAEDFAQTIAEEAATFNFFSEVVDLESVSPEISRRMNLPFSAWPRTEKENPRIMPRISVMRSWTKVAPNCLRLNMLCLDSGTIRTNFIMRSHVVWMADWKNSEPRRLFLVVKATMIAACKKILPTGDKQSGSPFVMSLVLSSRLPPRRSRPLGRLKTIPLTVMPPRRSLGETKEIAR